MKLFQRSTYGLCAAFLIAPLAAAQSECGDAVIVSSGDTLSKIAERCDTSVSALLAANQQLKDSNSVTSGSILAMPKAGARTYSTEQSSADGNGEALAPQEIDELVAPIALYPDVLLSEILPASTYPVEIVQAARWGKTHDDPEDADDQDWAPSIKALVHYPDALKMLNDDLDWTVRLGDAFLEQPDDVFDGIQRMRTRAEAAGNLKDTKQQVIVREQTEVIEVIRIVPANPRYVYVPYYDPYAVYYPYHGARVVHSSPVISFSTGFALGSWMNYGVNWRHRHIYHHNYPASYYRERNRRIITRRNSGYPTVANVEGRGERWRHNADRSRRHHDRAVVRNRSGNSNRSNVVNSQRGADRSRVLTNSRNDTRVNRLENSRSVRERNQQTVNRSRAQQGQQPRATAGAARTPQTNATRTVRTNNAARNATRNEVRRDQRSQGQQQRIQQQLNQRQRNAVTTRDSQTNRSAISRANSRSNDQSQRRMVQPRASTSQPQANVQRRATPTTPRVSAPQRDTVRSSSARSNTVRSSRPQSAPRTSSRSTNVQRMQQSQPVRQNSSSERSSRSQSNDRNSNRGSSNRSVRVRER